MIGVSSESDGGLQRVRITGSLSVAELSALLEQAREAVTPGTPCLVDLSAASASDLRFGDVRRLAQLSQRTGLPRPGMRVGVVAPNPVTFGMCRMLQGMRVDLEDGLGVFTSEAEAAAWVTRAPRRAQA